ncbi:ethanolamine ammonia-lyase subunit EutC [soil metagenome]
MSKKLIQLQQWTPARVALGHVGNAIPTCAILKFQQDCAEARDAVHTVWNWQATQQQLQAHGETVVVVNSCTLSRTEYLKRPDLGRILSNESSEYLQSIRKAYDVVFIISDGLSAAAVEAHALPLLDKISSKLSSATLSLAPIVLAPYARVALSDEVGFYLNARIAVMFIGERPGLSASDSMGVYLTYAPKPGNTDSARNCISNIRPPEGLSYELATEKLLYLVKESLHRKLSGIGLKEETMVAIASNKNQIKRIS